LASQACYFGPGHLPHWQGLTAALPKLDMAFMSHGSAPEGWLSTLSTVMWLNIIQNVIHCISLSMTATTMQSSGCAPLVALSPYFQHAFLSLTLALPYHSIPRNSVLTLNSYFRLFSISNFPLPLDHLQPLHFVPSLRLFSKVSQYLQVLSPCLTHRLAPVVRILLFLDLFSIPFETRIYMREK
jgi:hypothetical protein